MAIRTSDQAVRATIETDSSIPLNQFIRRANALTDRVAAKDSNGVLSAALLAEIETCLAAHFYAARDQLYRRRSTGDASAEFQASPGKGVLGYTDPGAQAILLDETGYLAELDRGGKRQAEVGWLGKPVSEQTDYVDRD